MLAIATAATKGYLHCWPQVLRRLSAAASHHEKAHFIFATDNSPEGAAGADLARRELPEGWLVSVVPLDLDDAQGEKYKEQAQLRIAQLQGAAFALARRTRAAALWSVESDNLVPPDALRVLEWTLTMPTEDGGPFYHVAAATYPNGLFLGGFGTYQNPIAEDFLESERTIPPRLAAALAACRARLKDNPAAEREQKRHGRLVDRARKCPPAGNVFEVTAKHGWRRRGWMDAAYPGIGRGAVVPSDWCGMGCTLLSARALALATFDGYEGKGTQDLFLCWHRWHPAGLRIACVPHVAADHVKQTKDGLVHYRAYHEPEGECRGHLRQRPQPWIPC
jgi:hypothetical protein